MERNRQRFEALRQNVTRLGTPELKPIHGSAGEVLDRLPDPDRVFIGGSGDELPAILNRVAARLRPEGRVVQTAVTLDTVETARSFWGGKPFELSITQLQINRSAAIGNSLRFEALHPIFIVTAWSKR